MEAIEARLREQGKTRESLHRHADEQGWPGFDRGTLSRRLAGTLSGSKTTGGLDAFVNRTAIYLGCDAFDLWADALGRWDASRATAARKAQARRDARQKRQDTRPADPPPGA